MSRNVKFEYTLIDRTDNRILNIHATRQDAREEMRDWKAEGFDVAILQSRYQHVFTKQVR
jgi:hypothetical protein